MDFSKWEARSYKKLCKMYDNFFETLSSESYKCYNKDSHTIFNLDTKLLSEDDKNKIRNYWGKYIKNMDLNYHRYYIDKTGIFSEKFIPDDIFAKYIDGYLNNRQAEPGVADKNYFDMYFKGLKMPKTYLRKINGQYEDADYNLLTEQQAKELLRKQKTFIVKPSTASYGGKNIFFYNESNDDLEKFLSNIELDNIIFQEIINQNKTTAKLHPSSLNTIRVMTLLINNDVKILPMTFRIGRGNSKVDNASSGGIFCSLKEDGTLSDFAYDSLGKKFIKHPDGGSFKDVYITCMEKIKLLVKTGAMRLPHFRLIGWDIAIDINNEPLIIEANLTMSGLDIIETINGPLFSEYTDEVLDEVFINPQIKERSMDISQYV